MWVFGPSASVSRDGLVKSFTCRSCHRGGGLLHPWDASAQHSGLNKIHGVFSYHLDGGNWPPTCGPVLFLWEVSTFLWLQAWGLSHSYFQLKTFLHEFGIYNMKMSKSPLHKVLWIIRRLFLELYPLLHALFFGCRHSVAQWVWQTYFLLLVRHCEHSINCSVCCK